MDQDMTPARRRQLRDSQRDGHTDGSVGAAFGDRLLYGADEAVRSAYETGWHIARHLRLNLPMPTHINPVDAEEYAKGLYCEEVGESLTVIGSGGRFGLDAPGRDGDDSPRRALAKEMGDVLAAIEYACLAGLVDRATVEAGRQSKLAKLLSPASRDNLGRRLAPPPLGFDEPPGDQLIDTSGLPHFAGRAGPADIIGRRIIRYMPQLSTEFPDDVFAGWQLDDQDTWIVFAHPSADDQIVVDGGMHGADTTFIDLEIVSMTVTSRGFEIIAEARNGGEATSWTTKANMILGVGDDVRKGLVLMRRPAEFRDR